MHASQIHKFAMTVLILHYLMLTCTQHSTHTHALTHTHTHTQTHTHTHTQTHTMSTRTLPPHG